MIFKLIALAAALIGAAASGAALADEPLPGVYPATVLRVPDGATLDVRVQIWIDREIVTRIHLSDTHAPLMEGQCVTERTAAKAARRHLKALALGKAVILTDVVQPAPDGPIMARALLPAGEVEYWDLGEVMRSEGHAHRAGFFPGWCMTN